MAELGLIVLRAADAARTRRFYESLGLHFSVEQHEKGVLHYACDLGGVVLEIYPGKISPPRDADSAGATMLGLRVGDVDAVHAAALTAGPNSRRPPADSPFGRRAVIEDP